MGLGGGERMDGMRGRESSGIWHHRDLRTAALDPGVWYSILCEWGCRFITTWVRENEKASENRQTKTKA